MIIKYINKNRLIITVLTLTLAMSIISAAAKNAKADIAESVVRLHVIANSNSEFDQALKLKVRDRILKEAAEIFESSDTPTLALAKAREQSLCLSLAAEEVLKENGCNYKVRIETGEYSFPVKSYGEITLPKGRYNALRIVIGEGRGKNWWCVMFPPLCLVKGTVKLSEDSDAYLKSHLTKGEYALIKNNQAPNVEIRFKLLEILKKLARN